jgi:hypothetical protein
MSETFYGPVSLEWLGRGVWLSRAWEELGDQLYVKQAREQAGRFASLRGNGETVETFEPIRHPLHELNPRLWGTEELWNLCDAGKTALRLYRRYRELAWSTVTNGLLDGRLLAYGAPQHPGAVFEWVYPRAWLHLKPDPDDKETVRGEGFVYWHVRIINPTQRSMSRLEPPSPVFTSKRGPRPQKTDKTEEAMRTKYVTRTAALKNNTQAALAAEFGVSRTIILAVLGRLPEK